MREMELLMCFILGWMVIALSGAKSESRSKCFVKSGSGEWDVDGDDRETDSHIGGTDQMIDAFLYGKGQQQQSGAAFTEGQNRIRRPRIDADGDDGEEEEEEADDEAEDDEFEPGDRKKRSSAELGDLKSSSLAFRGSSRLSSNITGRLTCRSGAREMIHVTKVVVGVSGSGWCRSRGGRCTDVVADHPVMFSCEGEEESCEILVERVRLPGCRRPVNFVRVDYECLPDDSRLDICHFAEAERYDSIVVTSPAYPWVPLMHDGEYLTCECEISTDDKSVITMEYIQSEMSGKIFACDDEFLLVEKRDPRNKRKFKVESEICGSTRRESRSLDDSLVRLTYMAGKPNTTDSKRGFLAKFKALSRGRKPSRIQIKCEELSDDDNMVDTFGSTDVFVRQTGVPKVNVDPSTTKSRDVTTPSPGTTPNPTIGSAAGAGAVVGRTGKKESPPSQSSSGVLSAVVASLVSIIVVMGSIAVYFVYRRRRTRTSTRGSLKSNRSWYTDPVYTDPIFTTGSKPPETPTAFRKQPADVTVGHDVTVCANTKSEPASDVADVEAPPLPPKAPPRRKRRQMDEPEYDNAPLTMVRLGSSSSDEVKIENCYDNVTDI